MQQGSYKKYKVINVRFQKCNASKAFTTMTVSQLVHVLTKVCFTFPYYYKYYDYDYYHRHCRLMLPMSFFHHHKPRLVSVPKLLTKEM